MREISSDFLDPSASVVLTTFEKGLEGIRSSGFRGESKWKIPDKMPLRTVVSRGGYEPDDQGEHNVFAEIASLWEITPSAAGLGTKKSPKVFAVTGNASVRVRIKESGGLNDGRELAMWRMELGAHDSPGCFFHVQVLGEELSPPFPHSLSIPRLPAIAFTPMAALEFVLGELFQEEWSKRAVREGGAHDRWKSVQRRRLDSLLRWHQGLVAKCTGSPWQALKLAKPESNLFLND